MLTQKLLRIRRNQIFRLQRQAKVGVISFFRMVFLVGICFVVLYPIIQDISCVFKEERDFYDPSVIFIPKHFTLVTITNLIEMTNYKRAFINTTTISALSGIFQLASSSLVGYGFARFEFPLKKLWFGFVILTMLIPVPIIIAPLYIQFNSYNPLSFLGVPGGIKLGGTVIPITLLSVSCLMFRNGIFVYMFRQFFKGIPKELDEAAMLDGAGRFKIFYKVAVPSSKPIAISVFLFAFVWQWTDVTYTTTFMQGVNFVANSGSTVFAKLQETFGAEYNFNFVVQNMYAKTSTVLCMVPLLILYIFLQRYFTESIERSGIVG